MSRDPLSLEDPDLRTGRATNYLTTFGGLQTSEQFQIIDADVDQFLVVEVLGEDIFFVAAIGLFDSFFFFLLFLLQFFFFGPQNAFIQ